MELWRRIRREYNKTYKPAMFCDFNKIAILIRKKKRNNWILVIRTKSCIKFARKCFSNEYQSLLMSNKSDTVQVGEFW